MGDKLLLKGSRGEELLLPEALVEVLVRAAEILAEEGSLSLVALDEEVTTQTAAKLLSLSRQQVVNLLESGEMPFRKAGAHRRVHIQDVLTYRKKRG